VRITFNEDVHFSDSASALYLGMGEAYGMCILSLKHESENQREWWYGVAHGVFVYARKRMKWPQALYVHNHHYQSFHVHTSQQSHLGGVAAKTRTWLCGTEYVHPGAGIG
jgi:sugar phosphate isomerase/epimerase